MAAVAFALKDGWSDAKDYEVGGVMRRDATAFINVGERLRDGGGQIVTEDPGEIEALDGFEPLKRTTVEQKTSEPKSGSRGSGSKKED